MGKLIILKLDDGDPFVDSMRRDMDSFCDRVEVKSLYDPDVDDNQHGQVNLVITSSLVCKEINRIPIDTWKRLLVSEADKTVVLMTCREEGETSFLDLCQTVGAQQSTLHIYNYHKDKAEWYKAEGQLKSMLSQGNRMNIPRERTFILKPCITRQTDNEVVVVMFEDYPNVVSLRAKLLYGSDQPPEIRNLKKVRDAVWTLDTTDLKSGKYSVQIFVDNSEIGDTDLIVRDDMETLEETLDRTMSSQPRDLLARLLQLDRDSFDEELADMLQNSASFLMTKLFDGLSKCMKTDIKEPGRFEDFLEKYRCKRTRNVLESDNSRRPYGKPRSRSLDETIPEQAQVSDSDEELEITTSPLSTSKRFPHQHSASRLGGSLGRPPNLSDGVIERKHYGRDISKGYSFSKKVDVRDSGFSTGSSTGGDSRGEVRPPIRRERIASDSDVKGYDFSGGRQHPYDTIDEPTHEHVLRSPRYDPYDKTWENDPLPQGEMPKRQTDEQFSESTAF